MDTTITFNLDDKQRKELLSAFDNFSGLPTYYQDGADEVDPPRELKAEVLQYMQSVTSYSEKLDTLIKLAGKNSDSNPVTINAELLLLVTGGAALATRLSYVDDKTYF